MSTAPLNSMNAPAGPSPASGLEAPRPVRRNVRARASVDAPPEEGHVMVDVETMGTKPGCTILSIGAVRFDPHQDPAKAAQSMHLQGKNHFYTVINLLDSSARGFSSDPDTMRWWKKQSIWPELATAIMESDVTVPEAAKRFVQFLGKSHGGGGVKLWANSPSFDIAILRAMFKAVDQELPVDYRQEMDYRTVMELVYPHRAGRPERPQALSALSPHHALGDAAAQAHHLITAGQKLGLANAQNTSPPVAPRFAPHGDKSAGGRHMMLEVKTLGMRKGSALLSIGAVMFDPTARESIDQDPDNRFHVVLSNFDMGNYGFGSDPETVRWWKSQPIWPQLSMESVQSGVPLVRALKQLTQFMEKKSPDKVWANSPAFDIEMLRDAYTAARLPFPIEYRKEMDYRTIMDLIHTDRTNRPQAQCADGLPAHHALGDAIGQSRALVASLSRLTLDLDALASPRQPPSPKPGQVEGVPAAPAQRRAAFRLR